MRYVVTKNFQDKYTKEYYGIGATYETTNTERAAELERGGYIAPENTEAAQMAQTQAAQNSQANNQTHSQMAAQNEPKTVVNGKVVPINKAQAAEAARENNVTKTGIQQAHDNSTEPVQSGKTAKNAATQQTTQQQTIRQSNMQSGQQEMEQHINQAAGAAQAAQGQTAQEQVNQFETHNTTANNETQAQPNAKGTARTTKKD